MIDDAPALKGRGHFDNEVKKTMADGMTTIQGGILDKFKNIFFKGIESAFASAFDGATELKEEMGVLKQITKIPLKSNDSGQEYSLTIKLSPVKEKKDLFYVEAETDAPGLDVSSINKKTMRINSDSMKSFDSMIDKLLNDSKLEPHKKGEQNDDDASNEENNEDDVVALTEEVSSKIKDVSATTEDGDTVTIVTTLTTHSGSKECEAKIEVKEGGFDPGVVTLPVADDSGNVVSGPKFVKLVQDAVSEYAENNGLTLNKNVLSSTSIVAAFRKDKDTARLTAINASTGIEDALTAVYEVASDPDFAASLPDEGDAAFCITDCGDTYDVEESGEMPECTVYDMLFDIADSIFNKIRAFKWALGGNTMNSMCNTLDSLCWPIESLLNLTADWVVRNEGCYPVSSGIGDDWAIDFDALIGEDGKPCRECMEDVISQDVSRLIEILELSANCLSIDEQVALGNLVGDMKRFVAYR